MSKRMMATAVIAILIIAAFYYNRYRIAPTMNFNSLELTDLDNAPVKPEFFAGKKLYVDFFATWCGPCLREFPVLEQAQAMLQNKNFLFVCISDAPVEQLKVLKQRMGLSLLILHSAKKFQDINIYTFPTTYFVNKKEKIVFKKTDALNWNVDELVDELLKRMD